MLARYLRPKLNTGGSIVLFSGRFAFRIKIGTLAVAITNGAADTLTRSLAVELAPIRVNAISPGTIDTGAWDAFGEQGKADLFADLTERNPVRRIGQAGHIANPVVFCMTNTFLTGADGRDGHDALALTFCGARRCPTKHPTPRPRKCCTAVLYKTQVGYHDRSP
jgi:NAD(P)-dependent dehydrogenase (short-subunit alcohol dehydrogenase family)